MTSLSYDRIICLESQKIGGTYQRYIHYFRQILFIIYKYIKINILYRLLFETHGRKHGRNLSWSWSNVLIPSMMTSLMLT